MPFTYKYPHPAVTADCVIFGYGDDGISILLIERKNEPYKGCWALPGGFLEIDESIEEAARRELQEETNLQNITLEQFHVFSKPDRDPRERVITVAFYGVAKRSDYAATAGDDAARAQWFKETELPPLAFDHQEVIQMAREKLKEELFLQSRHTEYENRQNLMTMITNPSKDNKRVCPHSIQQLAPNEIFVFGSNLSGSHGGGAAYTAYKKFGAIMGQGVGLQGQSYGIPTMQGPVETICPYVDEFIQFAKDHPELHFLVTRIGCGIAGFEDREIAPLFKGAVEVENIYLPQAFWDVLEK